MPQSHNIDNTKTSVGGDAPDKGTTTKQNYTAIRYGNEKGSIAFGHIHQLGDVTSGVMLRTPDDEHSFTMDIDGERKGWTSSVQPLSLIHI